MASFKIPTETREVFACLINPWIVSGLSKGYGFVQYENEESAQSATDKLDGMLINHKPVYVGHFQRKRDGDNALSTTL